MLDFGREVTVIMSEDRQVTWRSQSPLSAERVLELLASDWVDRLKDRRRTLTSKQKVYSRRRFQMSMSAWVALNKKMKQAMKTRLIPPVGSVDIDRELTITFHEDGTVTWSPPSLDEAQVLEQLGDALQKSLSRNMLLVQIWSAFSLYKRHQN